MVECDLKYVFMLPPQCQMYFYFWTIKLLLVVVVVVQYSTVQYSTVQYSEQSCSVNIIECLGQVEMSICNG